jgi:hypothetical protein
MTTGKTLRGVRFRFTEDGHWEMLDKIEQPVAKTTFVLDAAEDEAPA